MLLHRQVHPSFLQADMASVQIFVPTSQSFRPSSGDNKKLSVADGNQIDAKSAFERYVRQLQSAGVLSVTHEECAEWNLPVVPDPLDDQPDHTLIDFSEKSDAEIKKAASGLRNAAWKRGWSYKPQ